SSAPSLAPCTVRSRTRPSSAVLALIAESTVVTQAMPSSMLRAYCDVRRCCACTSRAAAAAAGSSDGARKARCEVACSCSLASSDRLVCRWRMAVDAMLDGVVRGIIVRFLSSSDEAGAVDEHVQRLIDRGHDA